MEKEKRQKELLLQLRREMIGKFKCEPFKILPDSVINEIIDKQPRTLKQLKDIKGLPADGFRVKKYGEAIISIIKNWMKIVDIELVGDNDSGYNVDVVLKKMNVF